MGPSSQLDHLCRLCLKNAESLEEIFENDESSLVLRIMACVSLEVHKTDNLPKKICSPCRYQLEKTYIFRSRCRENDSKLRRHVKLLAAGKVSTMLEDLYDNDEEEFEASLQFIKTVDEAREQQRKKELDMQIRASEDKQRVHWEEQRKTISQEAIQNYLHGKRCDMVDVEVETCNLITLGELSVDECENNANHVEPINVKEDLTLDSEPAQDDSIEESDIQHEFADIEYETIEEDFCVQEDEAIDIAVKQEFRTNVLENISRQEEVETVVHPDQEVLMEVDAIEEVGDTAGSVTTMNDDDQSVALVGGCVGFHAHSTKFVIPEVSDSESFIFDEELSEEQRKLYDITDDSDEDLEAVTNAVKAELAEQPGFNVGENCIMKVEKQDDLTKVEVRAKDGSVICMEFSTEPMKRTTDSLAALKAKLAKEFKCHHCSTVCKTVKLLQSHVQQAHPEHQKGQVCDVCGKWCPSKSGLKRHYRIHTGEKPFECGECGRGFIQKEILKRHMLIHTNEKPFFCEICPNRYNQKDQLKHHINVAHSNTPVVTIHQCSLCSKEFRYASGLSRHLSSHYGRTFDCECGKSFTDKSAMKRHQRDIHGEGKKEKESTKNQ